jgi:hypothetical protein
MGSTMILFGGVAVTYAACEAAMESFRGEADWKNGAVAGLATGVKTSPSQTFTEQHSTHLDVHQYATCFGSIASADSYTGTTFAGCIMGLRSGSVGVAATSGMMFAAASVVVDAFGGQERVNIFSQDGTPKSDPFANRIILRKY